jgi:hypothetical protein
MFRAFLMGYFLMQCETPESRFYKALRIVVRNPGLKMERLIDLNMVGDMQLYCS